MKWIVAIDLRQSSQGAVNLGAWLHHTTASQTLIGAHVVEGYDGQEESLLDAATKATHRVLRRCEVEKLFSNVLVKASAEPVDSLCTTYEQAGADGFLVGREGASADPIRDRLGEVSRGLLKRLPGPVVVGRPDLTRQDMPKGPVLVATDLTDSCIGALAFGRELAKHLGRELVVGHVTRRFEHPPIYMPQENWDQAGERERERATPTLKEWTQTNGGEVRTVLDEGPVGRRLLGMATVEEACVVVCGARAAGDAYISGIGNELAASARIPVAVVPPAWKPSA